MANSPVPALPPKSLNPQTLKTFNGKPKYTLEAPGYMLLEAPSTPNVDMTVDKMEHPVCMLSGSMSQRLKVTRFWVISEEQVVSGSAFLH